MPNTKPIGVAYSDPLLDSVTVTGASTLAAVTATTVAATGAVSGATLTSAADLTSGIISCNKGSDAATALTLPLATALDTLLVNAKVGSAFDVVVLNVASGSSADVTVTTNTGWTLSGLMVVQNATSAAFRARKTGAGAWTLYAIS